MLNNSIYSIFVEKTESDSASQLQNGLALKRREISIDKELIKKQLTQKCGCNMQCYTKFDVPGVMYWRMKIHRHGKGEEKMIKLMEIFRLSATDLRKNERNQLFKIDQKLICRKTFISLILNVSIPTFTRVKRAVLEGKSTDCHVGQWKLTHAWRGKKCEGFIRSYIKSMCDNDPKSQRYRMPIGLSRINLFYMYKAIYKDDALEKSSFYNVLKTKFPQLSFNKTQRFTKCTECSDLCEIIEKETDPQRLIELKKMLEFHHQLQQMEREAYYVRCGLAEMRPKEYLSVILDGMDQNKTDLPHYIKWNNPNGAGAVKLRTHVTGGIVHGRGKYFFIDYNQVQHNTNLTLSCLLKILKKEATNKQLPPTLFVQLDNTCRENKNKYFVGMMAYLVKKGFVKEVWMSFLIVGHTHEDVDQSFSKISHQLSKTDAITLQELHNAIQCSQKPVPYTENVHAVWNISSWLEEYINPIHNVTFPKLYRIFNDGANHTTVKFKVLASDEEWHPKHNEKPLEIFKMYDNEQKVPPGFPDLVQQCIDNQDLLDLKRSLSKDFSLAKLTTQKIEWWKQFLENPTPRPKAEEALWPLKDLINYSTPDKQESCLGDKERELVQKYIDKRNQFKQVYTSQVVEGATRGTHVDRRRYIVGEFAICKKSSQMGKVLRCADGQLSIDVYKKDKGKFTNTGQQTIVDISDCLPGSFVLTYGGNLPQDITNKLRTNDIFL